MTWDRQNPFHPQPATNRRDRVRERDIVLARPFHHPHSRVPRRQPDVKPGHHRIQAEQAEPPAALCFGSSPALFPCPDTRESPRRSSRYSTARYRSRSATLPLIDASVVKRYPSRWVPFRSWTNTRRIGPGACRSLVPMARPPHSLPSVGRRRTRRRSAFSVAAVAATTASGAGSLAPSAGPMARLLAENHRRRIVQVGVGIEEADQAQVTAVPMCEAGQGVGAVTAVAREDELAVGEPVDQDSQHLPHQFRGRLVPPPCRWFSSSGRYIAPSAEAMPIDEWQKGPGQARSGRPTCAPSGRR